MIPTKTELGEFLRTQRLKRKLTQSEVAKLAGMSQNHYSNLETGLFKSLKKQNHVNGLSRTLRCKPRQLIKFFEPEPLNKLGKLIWKQQIKLGLIRQEFFQRTGINPSNFYQSRTGISWDISYHLLKLLIKANLEVTALINYVGRKTEHSTKNALGRLIRKRRKELGLSQFQLAKKAGISRAYLSKIELGEYPLNTKKSDYLIARFAQILELDYSRLQAARPPIRSRG